MRDSEIVVEPDIHLDVVHDEVVEDIVVHDVMLDVLVLIDAADEIEESDYVAIYLVNMCDMHLVDDEVLVLQHHVICMVSLVEEEMVDIYVVQDVQLLVIEVDDEVHEPIAAITVQEHDEMDVNEFLLLDTQVVAHIKFHDEITYMNVIDIVYIDLLLIEH